MIRRLLWLLFFVAIGWFIRSLLRQGRSTLLDGAGGTRKQPNEGKMVRDRICNTFLPRGRALSLHQDGQEHFFCSESCRSVFLEGRNAVP